MGSFKAAVAFYAKQGNADTDRSALLKAIHYMRTGKMHRRMTFFSPSAVPPIPMRCRRNIWTHPLR